MMRTTHGQRINQLEPGQSIVIEKIPAGGSMEARRLGSGSVMFYWRHTRDLKTERLPIGHYDPSAPPKALQRTSRGFSVAAALEAARQAAKQDQETPGGLRAERERDAQARATLSLAAAARAEFTLKALCTDYCEWLRAQGKDSHRDVRNIFKNHLWAAHPGLAATPAGEVHKRQVVDVVRRLMEAGKKTTARKLRAYLRAAFACAVRADSDPNLPQRFASYEVSTNPVEGTAPVKASATKNPLSGADLRKYWAALQLEQGVVGAALRLHLVSGGQRAAQLTRLRKEHVTHSTIRLLDPKGKRTEPRVHLLPVTSAMATELETLSKPGYLLSTDAGKTPMHSTSLSTWSQAVAERASISDFQLKRVRSGIETLLAELGVPLHIRGQLQSHGMGGVQERHYDAHEYLEEKASALEKLHRYLAALPRGN